MLGVERRAQKGTPCLVVERDGDVVSFTALGEKYAGASPPERLDLLRYVLDGQPSYQIASAMVAADPAVAPLGDREGHRGAARPRVEGRNRRGSWQVPSLMVPSGRVGNQGSLGAFLELRAVRYCASVMPPDVPERTPPD